MMKRSLLVASLLLLCQVNRLVAGDLVLSERVMNLALESARLSSAMERPHPKESAISKGFRVYEVVEDRAIVAEKGGYCFATYRGSCWTWTDWDAVDFGRHRICTDIEPEPDSRVSNCCSTRIGFAKAYNMSNRPELERALRSCAQGCASPDNCTVFGGHSQGGAVAAVASVAMADLNPLVFTFGQPATIDAPCHIMNAERLYRFVNTKVSHEYGVTYDPVPFIQGLGADDFGHMIFLGEDSTSVASLQLGVSNSGFQPVSPFGLQAHAMVTMGELTGYLDRLKSLVQNASFPIGAIGFADDSICSDNLECESRQCEHPRHSHSNFTRCTPFPCSTDSPNFCPLGGRCVNDVCVPKQQSCMTCQQNEDCRSGLCWSNRCTGSSGLMDVNCICHADSECTSGRCRSGICQAKLGTNSRCETSNDCLWGSCTENQLCESPNKSVVPTPAIPESGSSKRRNNFNWKSLFVVAMCCMVATYLLVKNYLRSRKGYDQIPVRHYV